jgi:hypothetical protein
VVARTDGDGLSLRSSPSSSGERIKVWPEGTRLVPLGQEHQGDGITWARVRDPDGNEGWAAAQFLVDEATFATLPTAVPRPVATAVPAKPAAPTAAPTRAGPTATFPPLRPTFTPATGAPPPAPKPAGPTATAPAKPGGPTAPAKPEATAPSKPAGSPTPAR